MVTMMITDFATVSHECKWKDQNSSRPPH